MLIKYIILALSAFGLSAVFLILLKKLALKYKLLTSAGIPFVGGIGFGISFIIVSFLGFLFIGCLSKAATGIIASSLLMLAFGFIDDKLELSISAKFLAQAAAVSLLILFGVSTHIVYIGNFLNIIITVIWVLGITNAFNHLDVMDGLAGMSAFIAGLSFFIISAISNNSNIAMLSLILMGSVSAFLIFNFPPAKVYMGNSGSHFLGFVLSAIALAISYAPMDRKMALLSPVLILGLPIFDTAFLIFMRLKQGRSVFMKSNDHLALKILSSGASKVKALAIMFFFCLVFSFVGVFLCLGK